MKSRNFIIGFFIFFAVIISFISCVGFDGNVRDVAAVYHNLGNSYFKQKEYAKAEEAYLDALAVDAKYIAARYNLARVQMVQNKFEEAEASLKQLSSISPDNSDVLEAYAYLRYLQNLKTEAFVFYQQVLILDTKRQNSLFNSGLIKYELEDYAAAIDIFKNYYEYFPEDGNGALFLARAGMKTNKKEEFLKYYDIYLEKNANKLDEREEYLENLMKSELFEEALAQVEILLEKNKDKEKTDLLFTKAYILLVAYEDYVKGEEVLSEVLEQGFSDKNKLASIAYAEDFLYAEEIEEKLKEANLLISIDEYNAYLETLVTEEIILEDEEESVIIEKDNEEKDNEEAENIENTDDVEIIENLDEEN